MKYFVAIPTYNGGELWKESVAAIKNQASNLLIQVIDSSSKDNTVITAKKAQFEVDIINSADFNHGGTRNLAWQKHQSDYDIVVFLTQDAIVQVDAINKLVDVFKDPQVACAYGRQLPHDNANAIARHARFFNYKKSSYRADKKDIPLLGLKTCFMSNSFSAYRIATLKELGGFPSNTILCEDMYYTAKAVLAGYKVAYVADAEAKHSHNYTPVEEFKRYFDIGVFHTDESWIRKEFGGAGGEGKKFIISELFFLIKNSIFSIPRATLNNLAKILGYKLGQNYKKLPGSLITHLSMHKRFWS